MKTEFSLEVFFERDEDQEFAKKETRKLCQLVSELAPHIELRTKIQKASKIHRKFTHEGRIYYVLNHEPIEEGSQTLVITNEDIDIEVEGQAGPERGCLSKQGMESKTRKGGNSAEITIHEWLHTIAGKPINGRTIPDPDCKEGLRFRKKGPDGEPQWLDWYRYMLRAE